MSTSGSGIAVSISDTSVDDNPAEVNDVHEIVKHLNPDGSIDESFLYLLEENLDDSIAPFKDKDISVCQKVPKPQFLVRFASTASQCYYFPQESLCGQCSGVFIAEDLTSLRVKFLTSSKIIR